MDGRRDGDQNGNGQVQFAGGPNASFERHLEFDHVVEPRSAGAREQFEALARSLRDLLTPRWLATRQAYDRLNPKQVCWLSMEFLPGRSLGNIVTNLRAEPLLREAMRDKALDWAALAETEPDAALGDSGPGRRAACFLDSLATARIPATGYGLRYEYGAFRQEIIDGWQVEHPDPWLRLGDPWEVARPTEAVEVPLAASPVFHDGRPAFVPGRPATLLGIPYDRPVVGYAAGAVNTLRLWGAASSNAPGPAGPRRGDLFGAAHDLAAAAALTRVFYPPDAGEPWGELRFVQEYFLAACSLADLLARFRRRGNDWDALPDRVAVQLNGTHPSIAVAELMRLLVDREKLDWDRAWDLTVRSIACTSHAVLPGALEKWPVRLFETFLPRHQEIIEEINCRFLDDVRRRYEGDDARVRRMSLFEEGAGKQVRMAHLAVVGSHATNGVSETHSRLLAERVLPDFVRMFPGRFRSETGGVSPRRFLLQANPDLARLVTDAVGDGWVTDLSQLRKIVPLAEDAGFRAGFRRAARDAKVRCSNWAAALGYKLDPDTIFDSQVGAVRESRRQLLNLLHVAMLYDRLRESPHAPESALPRRTFLFAGRAAPSDSFARLLVKLIHNVGAALDADPVSRDRLRVVFLPGYDVTLAERLIPAGDVSEQISTAGCEAGGTTGMKFMMNGALTVGTRDGTTLEMAREAGEENLFLFGLTAEQVQGSRGWYSPWWHFDNEPPVRAAVDLLFSDHFSHGEPGLFNPVRDRLLNEGDRCMHLADLTSYAAAHERVAALWAQPEEWAKKAVINVGRSGPFSSDRAVSRYARDIWGVGPCPV